MYARALGILVLLASGEAAAIGPSVGLRLGTGPGFGSGSAAVEDTDFSSFSVGPALQIDMAVVAFEVNLLYTQVAADVGGIEVESTEIDLPLIAQIGVPVVPKLLTLKLGAGIQPRFRVSATMIGSTTSCSSVGSFSSRWLQTVGRSPRRVGAQPSFNTPMRERAEMPSRS